MLDVGRVADACCVTSFGIWASASIDVGAALRSNMERSYACSLPCSTNRPRSPMTKQAR